VKLDQRRTAREGNHINGDGMKFTRRQAMGALAGSVFAGFASEWRLPRAWGQAAGQAVPQYDIATGPFQPTWASLEQNYHLPDWYRDAKFGIWMHWGPQCQPGDGDWYAKYLYDQGKPQYQFHLKKYGHPSKFGFKDVINEWKAEKWDPAALIQRFKGAGARFLVSMANHHDNFDNFDSKYQPWNSVNIGPKKDVVGIWAKLAREAGLNFGVSVHAARAWNWYEDAQGSDKTGPLAGIPYDGKLAKADGKGLWWEGLDPQDLYAQNHAIGAQPDAAYVAKFFNRVKDLLDKYHPDLVFFDDSKLPLGDTGLNLAAHFFNANQQWHDGNLQAIIIANGLSLVEQRAITNNLERNMTLDMLKTPWNKGNCLGPWHYSVADYNKGYQKTGAMIHLLVDVVSKNGTFILAIPLPGSGEMDDKAGAFLDEMSMWMNINSECIYGTRPWVIYGEGPSVKNDATAKESAINPPRGLGPNLTAKDIRFTTKGDSLYAVVMGQPEGGKINIKALAAKSVYYPSEIGSVQLLGSSAKVEFARDENGLMVTIPGSDTPTYAIALKIIPKV
jgi:alpha-L-fucosidase